MKIQPALLIVILFIALAACRNVPPPTEYMASSKKSIPTMHPEKGKYIEVGVEDSEEVFVEAFNDASIDNSFDNNNSLEDSFNENVNVETDLSNNNLHEEEFLDVDYTLSKDSKVTAKEYVVGDQLEGQIFIWVMLDNSQFPELSKEDILGQILSRDIERIIIDIFPLESDDNSPISSIEIEDISASDSPSLTENELLYEINLNQIQLPTDLPAGNYSLKWKLERTNGEIIQKADWISDFAAAKSLGFQIKEEDAASTIEDQSSNDSDPI